MAPESDGRHFTGRSKFMDNVDRETRSRIMRAIRSSGNVTTEVAMAKVLRAAGLGGWRRSNKLLPGKPDFVWRKSKVALFVHGDYWHGNRDTFRPPKSNVKFWRDKIKKNRERDARVAAEMRALGWTVFVVWESDLKEHAKKLMHTHHG
jgi:DNA mismatch endonuclease (patch repair protein)